MAELSACTGICRTNLASLTSVGANILQTEPCAKRIQMYRAWIFLYVSSDVEAVGVGGRGAKRTRRGECEIKRKGGRT